MMKLVNHCRNGIIVLLISATLIGCAAVVVAGAAGGLAVYDRRSVTMMEKDARIFYLVHTTIVRDPRFKGSRIVICSYGQVVLLLGQTPAASVRELAEKIAHDTPNVRRVYNQIMIDPKVSVVQQSKDTWITGEVRSRMLTKKGLESGSIHVVTENGIVYLMGIVTPEQADLAVSVARRVNGVRKVDKIFQYIR